MTRDDLINPDVCTFCAARGCLDGTVVHSDMCPFTCGIWPVTEEDIRREVVCAACNEPFAAGDNCAQVPDMTHPAVEGAIPIAEAMRIDEVTFTVCVPCAAMGAEIAP